MIDFTDHYSALSKVAGEKSDLAGVFLPYIAPGWHETSNQKLLYCGKATLGEWDQQANTAEGVLSASDNLIKDDHIDSQNYHSAYWYYAREILKTLNPDIDTNVQLEENFVWTNLTKLARKLGNLSAKDIRQHQDLFTDILRYEIESLKPDVIVFVTSWYANEVIADLNFGDWRHKPSTLLGYCDSERYGCKVFHTRHPQGWRKEDSLKSLDFISEKLAR